MDKIIIKPQDGPQSQFSRSLADIAIFGGAAGGGKSFGLLLEPLYHIQKVKGFDVVAFRKTSPEIRSVGGLWDTSKEIYLNAGAIPKETTLEWLFMNGNRIKFSHMEYEKDVYAWQGSQIPLILWDELTAFSKQQFFYMLSRNRSMCGVKPYIRATCNPDSESWVAEFISWWIDQSTGFPIPERSGVLRYFMRQGDNIVWFDTYAEAQVECDKISKDIHPKSVTFIPAKVHDNKILLKQNPDYLANLYALSLFERKQLLEGNWKVRRISGMFFKREWFKIIDTLPAGGKEARWWDRAATEPSEQNLDPDWTAGVKLRLMPNGEVFITDVRRFRKRSSYVEDSILNTAQQDGIACAVVGEQEPGASGKSEVENYMRILKGFNAHFFPSTSDKVTSCLPFSAQCERGNVKLLRAPWNEAFLNELESFNGSDKGHDDQADASGKGYNYLASAPSGLRVTTM